MPDKSLDSLSSDFYPKACILIARCCARGVPTMIAQTSRTMAEHQTNLANGTSGTSLSLHLPRSMRWQDSMMILNPADADKSDAIDLVPYDVFQLHGPDKVKWDGSDPAWGIIGEEAERLGLRWGGRWLKPVDLGHAELLLPWKAKYIAEERSRPWPTFRAA